MRHDASSTSSRPSRINFLRHWWTQLKGKTGPTRSGILKMWKKHPIDLLRGEVCVHPRSDCTMKKATKGKSNLSQTTSMGVAPRIPATTAWIGTVISIECHTLWLPRSTVEVASMPQLESRMSSPDSLRLQPQRQSQSWTKLCPAQKLILRMSSFGVYIPTSTFAR